jgi:hypothetical protein
MQRKLTLSIDEDVYNGLRAVIGPRKISRFIQELVRPQDKLGTNSGTPFSFAVCRLGQTRARPLVLQFTSYH